MPIDPASLLRQAAPVDLMDSFARVLQMNQQMQQSGQQKELNQQKIDEGKLQLAAKTRDEAGQAALASAVKANVTTDPVTNLPTVDHQKVAAMLAPQFPSLANNYLEAVQKTDQSRQTLLKSKRQMQIDGMNHLGEYALNADKNLMAGGDPAQVREMILAHLAAAAADQIIPEDRAKELSNGLQGVSKDAMHAIFQRYISAAPDVADREAKSLHLDAETRKLTAEAKVAESKAGMPDAAKFQAQIDAIIPPEDKTNAGLRARTIARVQNARTVDDAEKALDEASKQMGSVEVAKATAPIKIDIAGAIEKAKNDAAAQGVTADAIDAAALKYHNTGEMSGLGMGNPVLRRQIMNREAELFKGTNLAENSAEFKANQSSLKNITGTLDTLTSFEKTAGKNLDQFIGTYQKLADAGSPLLNVPIRALQGKLGNPDVAAAHAAGQVALREIARVTNDPKLSGALTDSARQEVTGLIPAGATLKQVMAVASILKQDMSNVHTSLDEQKANIAARIGGGAAPPPTVQPTMRFNPATGKVEPIKPGGQ